MNLRMSFLRPAVSSFEMGLMAEDATFFEQMQLGYCDALNSR
jgi:hypothetical protein